MISTDRYCAVAVWAAAFFFCASANAQVPVRGRAMIAPTFGQSIFSDTPVTRTAMRYELEGGVTSEGVDAGVRFGFTHWITDRGPLVDRLVVSDMTVGSSYALLRLAEITLRPRVDVVLPTSTHSRKYLSLWFASHLGFDAEARAGERFKIVARARLRRDVHQSMTPEIGVEDFAEGYADPGPFGFRTAGSRLVGREDVTVTNFATRPGVVASPINVAWGTHLGLAVVTNPFAGFVIDTGFGWTHTWSYKIVRPANVIASDAQPDRLQLNIHTATFGLGWVQPAGPITLGVRFGAATTGRSVTADEERLRLPWWNLEDPSTDDSVLDVRLTVTYR